MTFGNVQRNWNNQKRVGVEIQLVNRLAEHYSKLAGGWLDSVILQQMDKIPETTVIGPVGRSLGKVRLLVLAGWALIRGTHTAGEAGRGIFLRNRSKRRNTEAVAANVAGLDRDWLHSQQTGLAYRETRNIF